ncbi:MAG: pitrilysin family protein [Pygmaiobacter sp.]
MKTASTRIYNERSGVAVERIALENGLVVLVAPMEGYSGVHAVFGTNFGSVDRAFRKQGTSFELPAGIAHFLEHKMFENEEGDAFTLYAKTGASANAFTGFDRTCYVFTATQNIDASLDILLSFVSRPYFTKETVEKEQGIIGQEIKMYDDSPDWRMMFALLQSAYHCCPVRDDIAGSVDSIAKITPELLYACTDAFYTPGNMVLAVAGNITKEQVLAAVERAELRPAAAPAEKLPAQEPAGIVRSHYEFEMSVAQPMFGIIFKEAPWNESERFRKDIICDLITELICGEMTPLFRRLYDEGLINSEFAGEVGSGVGYNCIMFSGETSQPDRVREELLREIRRLKTEGIAEEDFELCRNLLYGEAVGDLESIESVATTLAGCEMRNAGFFEQLETLANLTREEVQQTLQSLLREEDSATVQIRPTAKKGDESAW